MTTPTPTPAQAPSTWGESTWQFLHCAAASYDPASDREAMAALLASLGGTLPCAACRSEWTAFTRDHPPALDTRAGLNAWLLAAHNAVNARIGAPLLTVASARERYASGSLAARAAWSAALLVAVGAVLVAAWVFFARRRAGVSR